MTRDLAQSARGRAAYVCETGVTTPETLVVLPSTRLLPNDLNVPGLLTSFLMKG
ncbi:MAG TPA: hypothetical protein VGC87_24705 [Pyrinomonadaceae bacterium]